MSKKCSNCPVVIPNNSKQYKNKKYCSDRCKKAAFNRNKDKKTRIEQKKANLIQNDQFRYVIKQCRRAGTVQILHGHTLKSFTKTINLIKNREKGDVVLCHIAPVKGKTSIGLLHYKNLFYGGAYQNRKFGNNFYSGGLSIDKKLLLKKWNVDKSMSGNEILIKIEKFLAGIIDRYIAENPVLKSRKIRKIEMIIEGDPSISEDDLFGRSVKYLEDKLRELSRGNSFIKHYGEESKYLAYVNGLTRFIRYDRKRRPLLRALRKIMVMGYMALDRIEVSKTYNKYFYTEYELLIDPKYSQAMLINPRAWSEFKDLLYDAAFKVLHGYDLNVKKFRKKIMSYLTFPEKAWKQVGPEFIRYKSPWFSKTTEQLARVSTKPEVSSVDQYIRNAISGDLSLGKSQSHCN